ncbi:MAG: nucleotide exchange factor GrpE [bacterium]
MEKEHWTRRMKRELEEYKNALIQLRADFENYKRRTARHFEEIGEFAKSELLKKILPIVDDFERALSFENNPYAEGMRMIYRQLVEFLQKEGVEKMETVGKEFDPNLHEAVGWVESEDKEGIVVEEVQTGYTYRGKLLRPARVKVARKGGNNA